MSLMSAERADIPRKKGPALLKSDMLVVNKIELALHVEVDLAQMRADTKKGRGDLPFYFWVNAQE